MAVDLLICVATEFEGALLREQLDGSHPDVAIVRTGVGPVNAAHAVTLFLAQADARAIVICGVGGAYPSSGVRIGDVVCAASECYGDLGATSPSGFLDMKALGFPIVDGPPPIFNDLPMQIFPIERRVPFVTVSSCTGTDTIARELESRTGGAVESMEGAAFMYACLVSGVRFAQVRAVSNMVEKRNRGAWKLGEAIEALNEVGLDLIEHA
jgi:futalosine hydrolase